MSIPSLRILRRYEYDPLDRLTGIGPLAGANTQRFYQEGHLTTELGPRTQRTILRHEAQPLAQQQSEAGGTETTLLATDRAHSLLQTVTGINPQQYAYTAYGHHPAESGLSRLLGFNGECPDDVTGNYPLGRGNRFYNPALMRFTTPDEFSPFDEGGINAYAYCGNDPVNNYDPTGNSLTVLFRPWNFSGSAPAGLNLIKRPSVIVRSPLSATRRTASNVSPPISVKSNPILEGPLDQTPRNLQQPETSRSIRPSLSGTSEVPLELTGRKITSQPIPNRSYRQKMADIERQYDQYKKNYPNTPMLATPELSDRLSKINYLLSQSETNGTQRQKLLQQRSDAIRRVKRDTLDKLKTFNRTIRK